MTTRLGDVDDAKLDAVRVLLGTWSLKATVDAALDDLTRFAETVSDLDDPEIMAKAWQ